MLRRITVVAAMLAACLLLAPEAGAKTLREPTTGMTLKAPRGYKLTFAHSVFTLRGPRRYVQFTGFRSPFSAGDTGAKILANIKANKVKGRKATASSFRASAKVRGRAVKVKLTVAGGVTHLFIYGGKGGARAATASRLAAAAALTPGDVAALDRILRTRQGEQVQNLDVGIPMKQFQAPVNNGASALVPDLPGWNYGGTDTGYIYGSHPTDGGFELGGYVFVNYPTSPFPYAQYPTAQLQDAAGALTNVFPAWKQISAHAGVVFQTVNPLPGTEGNLGPGYASQAFEVSLTVNGQPFHGVFNVGSSDYGSIYTWGMYYSYVVTSVNAPGGELQALFKTWGSWNNSAASAARIQSALQTLMSIRPIGAGPIDPDVFQNAADAWSEYIRGP